jgi:CubicO group peptidase (beta-lactamase class C family)
VKTSGQCDERFEPVREVPRAEDTIVNVYSTTEIMAARCVLMLPDQGELDLSAPVARNGVGVDRRAARGRTEGVA